MALYHLSVKPMSRKGGRSATAAIAYRAAEKIHDLTSDQVFDYTRKRGVEHTEIVLPTAAAKQDINWARERQALWNAAERAEKRKDARVAREYEVALPHELNREQRVELVRAFAADLANRYHVAVDFAIHAPHRSGDQRNHHTHLMTTTREITPTGLGEKTDIELGERDRAKKGLQSGALEIDTLRARWETLHNEYLKEHGIEARIDHRSLAAQGIEREPTSHLGPAVSAMERRGMETEVGKRIGWEMQAAAQERLERAANLGKLEREREQVQQSILDLSGDLKTAQQERGQGPAASQAPSLTGEESPTPVQKRGRFENLQLRRGAREREAFSDVRLSVPEAAAGRPLAGEALQQSLERYARAWMDIGRLQDQDLPMLPHQKSEITEAGEQLEKLRPGAAHDLLNALEYEPGVRRAMKELEGPQRSAQLLAGIENEGRIRRDPNLEAQRLVKSWNDLEGRLGDLRGWEQREELAQVQGQVQKLALRIKLNPPLEAVLRHRQEELGIKPRSRLARVMHESDLDRALKLSIERSRHRGLSL
jgi:hypothetical protein